MDLPIIDETKFVKARIQGSQTIERQLFCAAQEWKEGDTIQWRIPRRDDPPPDPTPYRYRDHRPCLGCWDQNPRYHCKVCGWANYCSRECQLKDRKYHAPRCAPAGSLECLGCGLPVRDVSVVVRCHQKLFCNPECHKKNCEFNKHC
jgi:hypothetical protein